MSNHVQPERTGDTGHIRANIRAEMARHGVTQRQLAAHLGVSLGAANARLTGATKISADELVAIAQLLRIEPSELLKAVAA